VWFGTGLSFFIFSYGFTLSIVKDRLGFFTNCARDSNAKKSIGYLKIALFSYFGASRSLRFRVSQRYLPSYLLTILFSTYAWTGIWLWFPILWLLGSKGFHVISDEIQHVFHCILDIIAKSCELPSVCGRSSLLGQGTCFRLWLGLLTLEDLEEWSAGRLIAVWTEAYCDGGTQVMVSRFSTSRSSSTRNSAYCPPPSLPPTNSSLLHLSRV
jgi:hypothetical protein